MRNSSYRKHTSSTAFVVVKIGTLLGSSEEIIFSNAILSQKDKEIQCGLKKNMPVIT